MVHGGVRWMSGIGEWNWNLTPNIPNILERLARLLQCEGGDGSVEEERGEIGEHVTVSSINY